MTPPTEEGQAEGTPVIGGLYELVAKKASVPRQEIAVASLAGAEAELIHAFMEDLHWQTAPPASPHQLRTQQHRRVFLFCDAEGPVTAAAIGRPPHRNDREQAGWQTGGRGNAQQGGQ